MEDDPRYEPQAVEASGGTLRIRWADGHVSAWRTEDVRRWCPCAHCNELRQAGRPVAEGGVEVVEAQPTGAYGIRFGWSDGHATGIYRWQSLRDGCPCEACEAARRAEGRPNPLVR